LVVDGVLTMCAAFATKSWHIYLGRSCLAPPRGLNAVDRADISKLPFCFLSLRALRRQLRVS
jgi:hypothetical protein